MGGDGDLASSSRGTNKGKFLKGSLGANSKNQKPRDKTALPNIDASLLTLHELAKAGDLAGFEAEVEKIRDSGADVEMKLQFEDKFKRLPIHMAAYFGHNPIVEKVLEECPACVSAMAQDGFLAAHFAAQQGHLEILRNLVKGAGQKADGEVKFGAVKRLMGRVVKGNKNMLHLACQKGHVETIKFLVSKGCSLEQKNVQGKSPWDLLSEEHRATLRDDLLALGASIPNVQVAAGGDAPATGSSSPPKGKRSDPKDTDENTKAVSNDPVSSEQKKADEAQVAEAQATKAQATEAQAAEAQTANVDEEEEEIDAAAMEAKLAALMGGGKKKKKKDKKSHKEDEVVEEEPPSKKAKTFSLEDVLKDSYS